MIGPDHLPEIHRIGVNRVCDAYAEREFCGRSDRATSLLRLHCNNGAGSGEGEEWKLLENHSRPWRLVFTSLTPSLEGPLIEQQQREWERNHHRLRSKPGGEGSKHGEIPLPAWLLRIPAIRPKSKKKEKSTKDIFALGDPRYRFDVDGMQSEENGDKEAWPEPPCRPHEQQKQQAHVHHVQKNARQMMPGGVQAEERDV